MSCWAGLPERSQQQEKAAARTRAASWADGSHGSASLPFSQHCPGRGTAPSQASTVEKSLAAPLAAGSSKNNRLDFSQQA